MIQSYVCRVNGEIKLVLATSREKARAFIPEGTPLHLIGFFNSAFKRIDYEKHEGIWSEIAVNWMDIFQEEAIAHEEIPNQNEGQGHPEAASDGNVSS